MYVVILEFSRGCQGACNKKAFVEMRDVDDFDFVGICLVTVMSGWSLDELSRCETDYLTYYSTCSYLRKC
jgi:hypothetical protein